MEYLLLFLEGMITFLSPCILPMFPLYISYFSGEDSRDKRGMMLNVTGFILGFTVVFTLIGILAGTLGVWLKEYSGIVNLVSGAIVVVFGLHYTGILKFGFLEKSHRMNWQVETFHFFSAFLFGMVFAIGWTPCVGTFLGSALMLAVQTGGTGKGAMMLFVYSMGLGIPFALGAMFLDSLKNTFAFFKRHYGVINRISGGVLMVMGIAMMTGKFQQWISFLTGGIIR